MNLKINYFKQSFFIHPFLMGLFFVLHNFNEVIDFYPMVSIVFPLLIISILIFILFFLFYKWFQSKDKAALLCSFILLFLFFFESIKKGILFIGLDFMAKYSVFFSILFLVTFGLIIYLKKTYSKFQRLNLYLSLLLFIYISIDGFAICYHHFTKDHHFSKKYLFTHEKDILWKKKENSTTLKRDIYFILFDGYTGYTSLHKYWNFRNDSLYDFLKTKGFRVLYSAKSNYDQTLYSIPSTLNLSYLNFNKINQYKNTDWARTLLLRDLILNNFVVNNLYNHKYNFVNYSLFDMHKKNKFYNYGAFELENLSLLNYLYKLSFFNSINRDLSLFWHFHLRFPKLFQYTSTYPTYTFKLDSLLRNNSLAVNGKPDFIYSHFVIPHRPYIFDSTGHKSKIDQTKFLSLGNEKRHYLSQLKFCNKLITNIVTSILLKYEDKPIIIIQGDHGFRMLEGEAGIDESHHILNAIYLPGVNDSLIYDSITSVNTFRLIFKEYFKQDIPFIEDSVHCFYCK